MQLRREVTIACDPTTVWRTWSNVAAWPEFIDTVHQADLLAPRLVVGARARLRQFRLPEDEWVVVALDDGRSWTWESRSPGMVTTATHWVDPRDDGTTTARVQLTQEGPIGSIVGRLLAGLLGRYLRSELRGLRRRCEHG